MGHYRGVSQLCDVLVGACIDQVVWELGTQDHMRIGMQEDHGRIVKEGEEIFPLFRDFQMHHVHFERHT